MQIELAKNIQRNIKHILNLCEPYNDRDSQLIDLANHIDTIAQQMIFEETGCHFNPTQEELDDLVRHCGEAREERLRTGQPITWTEMVGPEKD